MSETKKAYPLSWPDGWPRVQKNSRRSSIFGGSYGRRPSMDVAVTYLERELRRLKATDELLSTNVRVKLTGTPYSGQVQPDDTGIAVYFKLKGQAISLACDKWNRVECNVYAVAKHIEALRGQERWGVGSVAQAFRGYVAIAERAGGDDPWKILGIERGAGQAELTAAYREKAKLLHPDIPGTGSPEGFHRLQEAYNLIAQTLR